MIDQALFWEIQNNHPETQEYTYRWPHGNSKRAQELKVRLCSSVVLATDLPIQTPRRRFSLLVMAQIIWRAQSYVEKVHPLGSVPLSIPQPIPTLVELAVSFLWSYSTFQSLMSELLTSLCGNRRYNCQFLVSGSQYCFSLHLQHRA